MEELSPLAGDISAAGNVSKVVVTRIYLDHAATTPLLPQAREAMLPWLDGGNPSSLHADGRRAKDAIDQARETVSDALGCLFAEVLFTSGGTESANLGLVGLAIANPDPQRNRILFGGAEHHAVLHTKPLLARLGYQVELLKADSEARVDLDDLTEKLDQRVLAVSAMHANNELGTWNSLPVISDLCKKMGAKLHVDAVQTFGKYRVKVDELGADLLTITAHKFGGPRGAGALYVRAGTPIKSLIAGGGQERELRGGTENTAAIVGLGAAIPHVPSSWVDAGPRDHFLNRLIQEGAVPTVKDRSQTLARHAHVRFPGFDAETFLIRLDREGVSASSGAACSSGSLEPSHVLLAAGYSETEAKEGLRFTLGPDTDSRDAELAADRVIEVVRSLRAARQVRSKEA